MPVKVGVLFQRCYRELFGTFRPEKQKTNFSDVSLLQDVSPWNDLKSRVPFTFQPET